MSVQDFINILMHLNLESPIVAWEQGIHYQIQITKKGGYYIISADR